MNSPGREAGSVLALAVLVLVALQLLAHGALLMARAEWASSRAGLHLLQARAGAEAGALEALDAPKEDWDSVAPLAVAPTVTGSLAGHSFLGGAQRLAREYWLVEGRGGSRGETWGVTVRYLVWLIDPLGRVAAAEGGAEVGGALPDSDLVDFDAERPAFCRPWQTALDSVISPGVWGGAFPTSPSLLGEPSLGGLGPADLAALLPELAAGSGTPEPALRLGRCDETEAWNWGDPVHPAGPCGERLVAWSAPGDLLLLEGVGQGILVAGGDLELRGTRFDGVVLVGGSLTLRDGAEVRGMVRVGRDLEAAAGSRVWGSPCRALRALAAFRSPLLRSVRVSNAGLLEGAE